MMDAEMLHAMEAIESGTYVRHFFNTINDFYYLYNFKNRLPTGLKRRKLNVDVLDRLLSVSAVILCHLIMINTLARNSTYPAKIVRVKYLSLFRLVLKSVACTGYQGAKTSMFISGEHPASNLVSSYIYLDLL